MDQDIKEWIIGVREDFHRHPELSGQETRTTRKIVEILRDLEAEVTTFSNATGAVGLFKGTGPGPVVGLRADIDALPLQELGPGSAKSLVDGAMHACGHDANTAIVLGVARLIRETGFMKNRAGAVKLIFQPCEEQLGGAKTMIANGVLENPRIDRLIAGHMDPNFEVGQVGVFTRVGHAASDPFTLTLTGKGAHGARPHTGINPITAGAAFVSGLDGLSMRHVRPSDSAVISVGVFQAGQAGNVIPETAVIQGSVRTHDEAVRERLIEEIRRLARGVETMFNVKADLDIRDGAPMGINDEAACRSLKKASEKVLGQENVNILPFIMGSDDFYFYARQCKAAMMRLGCASKARGIVHPLHSPYFDIHEDVLEIGTEILFTAVKDFFEQ